MSKDIIYFAENVCGLKLQKWQKEMLLQLYKISKKGGYSVINVYRHQGKQLLQNILINYELWSKDQRIAELEEQLKNYIRPKFKIGQEVWSIFQSQYFRDCKELCNLEITAIMKTNKGIFYQGYVLEQGKNRSDYWFDENNTFLNKTEAQERLKELKGENK